MNIREAAMSVMAGREPARRPAVSSWEDSDLISEFLRTGSQELFAVLVERYKHRVYRLVASILGPGFAAEAEDLTQDVFIRVYHKLSGFRQESRFETWLYRLAYRMGIDMKRKARLRLPHVSDEVLAERPATDRSSNPLAGAVERETRRALHAAVEQLTEPGRTALYLYYWMDCSIAEIAECLALKPGTVKSHLYRSRERLARGLEGCSNPARS